MGVAEAEKQELMLALYIFMIFGVFTEYRSYCLEDIHIPPCWGGGSWEEAWEQYSAGVGKLEPACPQLWITDPPPQHFARVTTRAVKKHKIHASM